MGLSARARADLEAHWLELTRRTLPALAGPCGWPIRADHCFQRVLLDAVFGGVWYDRVTGRPAYRTMPEPALARAVALADAVVAGDAALEPLNDASLAWRRERRAAAG